jgi:hypothetical protein
MQAASATTTPAAATPELLCLVQVRGLLCVLATLFSPSNVGEAAYHAAADMLGVLTLLLLSLSASLSYSNLRATLCSCW